MEINQKIIKKEFIKIKVFPDRDKFRFTIPTSSIRKIGAKPDNYVKLNIQKDSHKYQTYLSIPSLPKSRDNLQVRRAVPKDFVEKANLKTGDILDISISLVDNIRTNRIIIGDYLDLLALIPRKTKCNKTIMVELFNKNDEDWLKAWYCSGKGGNAKSIELKRFVTIDEKLGEFFGLMQAESSKNGVRLDFTMKFLSQINLFMDISKLFGIPESSWKGMIFHNPDITNECLESRKKEFAKLLDINETSISLIKNKNLLDIIYSMYIPNTTLGQIMITILTKIRTHLEKQEKLNNYLREFSTGFIIKYLLGDGTVIANNSSLDIFISEGNLSIHPSIRKLLKLLNINSSSQDIKIHLSTNFEVCIWLIENNAFAEHKDNRRKLLKYVLSNYYFKILYERLKSVNNRRISEFAKKHNISIKTAQKYLSDNTKRGFLHKIKSDVNIIYHITKKGENFLYLMKSAKEELQPLMTPSGTTRATSPARPASTVT
ncbi:hypothetical protein ACFL0W_00655 [Nanoarchaeota archaeon]